MEKNVKRMVVGLLILVVPFVLFVLFAMWHESLGYGFINYWGLDSWAEKIEHFLSFLFTWVLGGLLIACLILIGLAESVWYLKKLLSPILSYLAKAMSMSGYWRIALLGAIFVGFSIIHLGTVNLLQPFPEWGEWVEFWRNLLCVTLVFGVGMLTVAFFYAISVLVAYIRFQNYFGLRPPTTSDEFRKIFHAVIRRPGEEIRDAKGKLIGLRYVMTRSDPQRARAACSSYLLRRFVSSDFTPSL